MFSRTVVTVASEKDPDPSLSSDLDCAMYIYVFCSQGSVAWKLVPWSWLTEELIA